MSDWIDTLPEEELLGELSPPTRRVIEQLVAAGVPVEAIGQTMAGAPIVGIAPKGSTGWPLDLWQRVVGELRSLICTDDARYSRLRETLGGGKLLTGALVIAYVEKAIAVRVGEIESSLLASIIAVGLLCIVKVGKEAWCKTQSGSPRQPQEAEEAHSASEPHAQAAESSP